MNMKSERCLGATLRYLFDGKNKYTREEFFISTKHGNIISDEDNGIPE